MLVSDVLMSLRFNLGDTTLNKYSDVELIEAINSVIRYANLGLVNMGSSITLVKHTLEPENGVAYLPDDFISLASIGDDTTLSSFKVIGNEVYTTSPIEITYHRSLGYVHEKEDQIPLPNYFYELLVRFAEAFITKTISKDMFSQVIYSEVSKITSGSEYPYIEREMPFNL